jgi:hypothetical protein
LVGEKIGAAMERQTTLRAQKMFLHKPANAKYWHILFNDEPGIAIKI